MFAGQAHLKPSPKPPYKIPSISLTTDQFISLMRSYESNLIAERVKNSEDFLEFAEEVKWPAEVKCDPRNLRSMYASITYAELSQPHLQEW